MNYTSLFRPTVSFETGLPPNVPGGRLLTRGTRAFLQPNGSMNIGNPIVGSMYTELLHEGSVFLCIAEEVVESDYPVELSRPGTDASEWIAHPFWLSLLVVLAGSGDVEASRALDHFLRESLRLDHQCVSGTVTYLTELNLTCTAVFDCAATSDLSLWKEDFRQNKEQFDCSWDECRCSTHTILSTFIRAGTLTEAKLLPRVTGILINNNGPMSMIDILEEVPITWTSHASVVSGLSKISYRFAEPAEGEMDWYWDGQKVTHQCSWQPGLELQDLRLISKYGYVTDGVRDIWYTWLLTALGGLTLVDPESIATETPQDVLLALIANHLVSHSKDPLQVLIESSTMLGRIDVLESREGHLSSKNTREVMNAIMTVAYQHFIGGPVQSDDMDTDSEGEGDLFNVRMDFEQPLLYRMTLEDLMSALPEPDSE